ncbi:MAG: family 78 glycoside hydrolase catalytic domain [Janthinobacterium lividum]
MTSLTPVSLRCEYKTNPLGIDTLTPRLFWTLEAPGERGARQTAYQIWVNEGELWDSGKVTSSETTQIEYAGMALCSGQRVGWKVKVWDENDQPTEWSEPAFWQMGLLSESDWTAHWISLPGTRPQTDLLPPSYLRRTFHVSKPIARATAFATARGCYTLHLNGQRVSEDHFAPGWTDYKKRIQYQTYDITTLIHSGDNALGALLGDGWYAGYIGFDQKRDHYGSRPELLAQIALEYADGSTETIETDSEWLGETGPIRFSDMLMGETYDARQEMPGWSAIGFDDAGWRSVQVEAAHDLSIQRVAQIDLPVRLTEELTPKAITQPLAGTYLFDIGQNMVGWARLKVEGPAGTIVSLRFGEVLERDGSLYVDNLRGAKATDTYILSGSGAETYEPHFTFHGFRYVEVTGYPGEPSLDSITGCVLHSEMPRTGTFECSEPMVNQLVSNIDWGQRGNFLSIPTDCPQRDERLGWMGDAQIFVRTAAGSRDVAAFFEKWMFDVVEGQSGEGAFSDVSPRLVDFADGAPAWADAGVIVPWTIYQMYGDTRLLETHYAAMARWVDFLDANNPDHLWLNRRCNDFGDWLSIDADTDKNVLATAYFAYDTSLLAKMAEVLGHAEDAARFTKIFDDIKAAFNTAYVTEDGRVTSDTQTAYVLALYFKLLPEALRPQAAQHLVSNIEAKNWHLSTGFVGVGYLCPALTEAGYADVAYKLLLNTTFPSWGYSIQQGATTIWERWDGWTEEKGFQDVGMNSFNHYSLGSVGEWLQRYVAGIDTDPDQPGFAHLLLQPRPNHRLTSVNASFESIRGRIESAWKLDGGTFHWSVSVPANTTATATLPDGTVEALASGSYEFTCPWKD